MSFPKLQKLCDDIVMRLRSNGCRDEAADLEFQSQRLSEVSTTADALQQIIVRCHPKWLGDLRMPNEQNNVVWVTALGRVAREAERAARSLRRG